MERGRKGGRKKWREEEKKGGRKGGRETRRRLTSEIEKAQSLESETELNVQGGSVSG